MTWKTRTGRKCPQHPLRRGSRHLALSEYRFVFQINDCDSRRVLKHVACLLVLLEVASECLCPADVAQRLDEVVAEVCDLTGLSRDDAVICLRHFQWQMSRFTDSWCRFQSILRHFETVHASQFDILKWEVSLTFVFNFSIS